MVLRAGRARSTQAASASPSLGVPCSRSVLVVKDAAGVAVVGAVLLQGGRVVQGVGARPADVPERLDPCVVQSCWCESDWTCPRPVQLVVPASSMYEWALSPYTNPGTGGMTLPFSTQPDGSKLPRPKSELNWGPGNLVCIELQRAVKWFTQCSLAALTTAPNSLHLARQICNLRNCKLRLRAELENGTPHLVVNRHLITHSRAC